MYIKLMFFIVTALFLLFALPLGAVDVDEEEEDDDSQCCDITAEGDDNESDLNNNRSTPVTTQLTKKKLLDSPAVSASQTAAVIFKERWKVALRKNHLLNSYEQPLITLSSV